MRLVRSLSSRLLFCASEIPLFEMRGRIKRRSLGSDEAGAPEEILGKSAARQSAIVKSERWKQALRSSKRREGEGSILETILDVDRDREKAPRAGAVTRNASSE